MNEYKLIVTMTTGNSDTSMLLVLRAFFNEFLDKHKEEIENSGLKVISSKVMEKSKEAVDTDPIGSLAKRIDISALHLLTRQFAAERMETRNNGGPDSLSTFIPWLIINGAK